MYLSRLSQIQLLYVFARIAICYTKATVNGTYFDVQRDKHIKNTPETTRYFARSRIECAAYCAGTTECCRTSFVNGHGDCTVDNSIGCTAPIEVAVGSLLLEKKFECATGWQKINGRCLLYSSIPMTFQSAESFCQSNGGRLVIIESSEKNAWLFSAVQHYSFRYGFLISAQRIGSYSFIWADGNGNQLSMSYTNWGTGEPNGAYRTNDCILFYKHNAKWDDNRCNFKEPVICEIIP